MGAFVCVCTLIYKVTTMCVCVCVCVCGGGGGQKHSQYALYKIKASTCSIENAVYS